MKAFGFHYPTDIVLRCFQFLDNWQILPDAGGLLDQDPQLLDDLLTCYRWYEYHRKTRGNAAPAKAPFTVDPADIGVWKVST